MLDINVKTGESGHHPFLTQDFILINAMVFTNDNNLTIINQIVDEINDSLKAHSKSKIAFSIWSEGIPYNQLYKIHLIIDAFIEKYKYERKAFMILLGASPCTENISYYKEHCTRFNWVNVPVMFCNAWEFHSYSLLLNKDSHLHAISTTPKLKPKKFVCYNRHCKPHRLYITTQVIKRNLLKDAFFSNYFTFEADEFNFGSTHERFPTLYTEIHKIMYDNRNLFPIDLGLASIPRQEQVDKYMSIPIEDVSHFNDSYFGVITESKFNHDNYSLHYTIESDLSLDGFMFTEKTYKFIAGKKPFILAGFTGSLDILRRSGYKTFHPFIDETYDTIIDDELRIEALMDEIERLCNLSDREILEWQKNIEPIVLHNYNILSKAGMQGLTYYPEPP